MFNLRDRAKWDAWKAVEGNAYLNNLVSFCLTVAYTKQFPTFSPPGKSKEEAMSDYITKVKQLLEEAAASAWYLVDVRCFLIPCVSNLKLNLK